MEIAEIKKWIQKLKKRKSSLSPRKRRKDRDSEYLKLYREDVQDIIKVLEENLEMKKELEEINDVCLDAWNGESDEEE